MHRQSLLHKKFMHSFHLVNSCGRCGRRWGRAARWGGWGAWWRRWGCWRPWTQRTLRHPALRWWTRWKTGKPGTCHEQASILVYNPCCASCIVILLLYTNIYFIGASISSAHPCNSCCASCIHTTYLYSLYISMSPAMSLHICQESRWRLLRWMCCYYLTNHTGSLAHQR